MNLRLLLDAHCILFALYEAHRLPKSIQVLLADTSNLLFVSEATLWEIVNKAAALRLELAGSDPAHIRDRIEELGVIWLPITQASILAAASLPLIHGDPFDRILVAEAQARDLTLVTKDTHMVRYDVRTLWT